MEGNFELAVKQFWSLLEKGLYGIVAEQLEVAEAQVAEEIFRRYFEGIAIEIERRTGRSWEEIAKERASREIQESAAAAAQDHLSIGTLSQVASHATEAVTGYRRFRHVQEVLEGGEGFYLGVVFNAKPLEDLASLIGTGAEEDALVALSRLFAEKCLMKVKSVYRDNIKASFANQKTLDDDVTLPYRLRSFRGKSWASLKEKYEKWKKDRVLAGRMHVYRREYAFRGGKGQRLRRYAPLARYEEIGKFTGAMYRKLVGLALFRWAWEIRGGGFRLRARSAMRGGDIAMRMSAFYFGKKGQEPRPFTLLREEQLVEAWSAFEGPLQEEWQRYLAAKTARGARAVPEQFGMRTMMGTSVFMAGAQGIIGGRKTFFAAGSR